MSEYSQPYKSLVVWKKADDFVIRVYSVTKRFPKEELYGITSQLRRAALSVPLNIVEGRARKGSREYSKFLYISRASLTECAYLLDVSFRLQYLSEDKFKELEELRREISFLLQRLIASLQPSP